MCDYGVNYDISKQIKLIRKFLKLKIMEDNISFRNHNKERQHVYDLMKRTVLHGESHSALIIGPRGSGKTTLLNSVLHQLSKEANLQEDAIVVRLDGLIQTDEKAAIKSITAQMQLENTVGDRVFGTFAENLSFLLECLQTADARCKSVIIILEKMDLFCNTRRAQTTLYNLFDITHNGIAPICVLGTTNRLDVMEFLEKRVKSRFSHRHIHLYPTTCLVELFVQLLTVPVKGKNKKRKNSGKKQSQDKSTTLPEAILERCYIKSDYFDAVSPMFAEEWNAHINALAQKEKVVDALEKLAYYNVNEQLFRNVMYQLVSKLNPTATYINIDSFVTSIDDTVAPEYTVQLLHSLSILELSLVIAMKHGMDIFDGQPMNFEMVLHRYTKFANANSSTQNVPRPVILKAFEHLQALEIIMPIKSTDSIYNAAETTASRVQKEYKIYTLAVSVEVINAAVKTFKPLPTEISHWYNNSIV